MSFYPINPKKRSNDEIGETPNLEQKKAKETSIVWDLIEKEEFVKIENNEFVKEEKFQFVKEWFNDTLEFNLETPRKLETKDFNEIKSSENQNMDFPKFTELRQPNEESDNETDIDSNKENVLEESKNDNESVHSDATDKTEKYERIETPMRLVSEFLSQLKIDEQINENILTDEYKNSFNDSPK